MNLTTVIYIVYWRKKHALFKMSTIFEIYFTFHYLNVNKLGYTSALLYDRKTYQPWKEWFLYYLYFCVEKK